MSRSELNAEVQEQRLIYKELARKKIVPLPDWCGGPITYELFQRAKRMRVFNIPGLERGCGIFFAHTFTGDEQSLTEYDLQSLVSQPGRTYYLGSLDCPKFHHGNQLMALHGIHSDRDDDALRASTVGGAIFEVLIKKYNDLALKSVGVSTEDTINGIKSQHNDFVPHVGAVYYFREEGTLHNDTWLYKDEDIARWRKDKISLTP